ncbi:MAG: type II toxin-antitoxin system Phd/YefM family antitoxin [Armatimonadota bacterium]
MKPRKTGVREAKAHLSRLLRGVQGGQEWIITDRGKAVARLVPASEGVLPLDDRMRRLIESGLIEPPERGARELPPPLPLKRDLAQEWLREDRRS